VLLCLTSSAFASGLWLPGVGVGPLGRAGAVVAAGDDPNQLWYNPGALPEIEAHQLTVDVTLIDLSYSFLRAPTTTRNGETVTFEEASNQATPQFVPRIMFSSDLGTDQFALGAGVYAPYAPRYRFDERGPQRYTNVDGSKNILLYQHLAFAWRPHPRFAFGAGIQNLMAVLDSTVVASSYVGLWGEPEDQDLDMLVNFKAEDLLTITGNVGVWAEPVDGLELGASVQFPSAIEDDEAKTKVRLPSHYAFDNAQFEGDTLKMTLELPWIIRAGVSWGIEDAFDIEADFTYETWSVHDRIRTTPDEIRVTGVPTVGEIEVGQLDIERNLRDAFGVSLGADWHVFPDALTLRAGFLYEQGATPDERYSTFQADSDKVAPTIGVSAEFGDFRLDAAYSFMFMLPRDISNSEVEQINPAYEDGAVIVGNGSYEHFVNMFGVGIGYTFGADDEDAPDDDTPDVTAFAH